MELKIKTKLNKIKNLENNSFQKLALNLLEIISNLISHFRELPSS